MDMFAYNNGTNSFATLWGLFLVKRISKIISNSHTVPPLAVIIECELRNSQCLISVLYSSDKFYAMHFGTHHPPIRLRISLHKFSSAYYRQTVSQNEYNYVDILYFLLSFLLGILSMFMCFMTLLLFASAFAKLNDFFPVLYVAFIACGNLFFGFLTEKFCSFLLLLPFE